MGEERQAVYVISVAAELAGVHPQTLRVYERKGLLNPERTSGNTRRYSVEDIQRLRRIQQLTQDQGVNLAGVLMVLELEAQMDKMRRELEGLADRVQKAETDAAQKMRQMARDAGAILPASSHRQLEQLLAEMKRRRAIPLGPIAKKGSQ